MYNLLLNILKVPYNLSRATVAILENGDKFTLCMLLTTY